MIFGLLGPLEVWAGSTTVPVGPPLQCSVLAVLAADAGRVVPVEVLVERVWGEDPPERGRRNLHTHIARVRRVVEQGGGVQDGPARVLRRSGGYLLDVDPDLVDLYMFRRLVHQARNAAAQQQAGLLREALGLWRGEPLAGLPGEWAARMRRAWRLQRVDATVAWADAELLTGNGATVVGPISDLIGEHPLDEPLVAVLMRALAAAGRPAEALQVYAEARGRLAEELGADPGPALQSVHQAILRGELALSPAGGRAIRRPVPAQLPADVPGFTGRQPELAELDALVAGQVGTTAVVVSAVAGTAGVGKTALAVRWAHQVHERFPDGQLYADLRGYGPDRPMPPDDVLAQFLRSLGVADEDIPLDVGERSARYRSELAGRKILVLLDNAGTPDQVRPLLPASPGCVVVVTSRDSLAGLVAVNGARRLDLDLLPLADAVRLLATLIGDRAVVEPATTESLARCCARLPLALRVAAELAVSRPAASLAELVAELSNQQLRLELLDSGDDPHTAVTVVFSWSLRQLPAAAARLFRLLGLHPGPEISAAAAASLIGLPLPAVRPLLARLVRAHLIVEHRHARYSFHDLLRAYARRLAHTHDSAEERRHAVRRTVDHYLHTAHAAASRLDPARDPIPLGAAAPGVVPESLGELDEALRWFSTELSVLRGVSRLATDAGLHGQAWQLAWALDDILDRRADWPDRAANAQAGLAAARRLGDQTAQAHAHRLVAFAHTRLHRHDAAHDHLRRALALSTQAGDAIGQAHGHLGLALALERAGRYADALRHARQSLDLYRTGMHRNGQANSLNEVGWLHALLGDYEQAVTSCRRALTLLQELDDRSGQAGTWDSLGYAYRHLGDHDQAIGCYRRSVGLYQDLGERYNEADTLHGLGDTYEAAGQHRHARSAWQRALAVLEQLDHPDAEQVRANLRRADQSALSR